MNNLTVLDRNLSDSGVYERINGSKESSADGSSVSLDPNAVIAKMEEIFSGGVRESFVASSVRDIFDFVRNKSNDSVQNQIPAEWIEQLVLSESYLNFLRDYMDVVLEDQLFANPRQRSITNLIKLMMTTWNCSDKSEAVCKKLVNYEIHSRLLSVLGDSNLVASNCHGSGNIRISVHSSLGILHNIVRNLPYMRGSFREKRGVERLTAYVTELGSDEHCLPIKTAALLLLAFLVDERQSRSLHATDQHIVYIVDILRETLEHDNCYSEVHGYHALELLLGIKNLAGPDSIKSKLVRLGILPLILATLRKRPEHPEEYASLELLWSLLFDAECHRGISQEMVDLVTDLAGNAKTDTTRRIAEGIVYNLKHRDSEMVTINKMVRAEKTTPNPEGHVMISYQHSTQDILVQVKDRLLEMGYKVWMDVDYMRGSFVDAMADGIQQAAVLLLGLCQAFKNSPHCRQEVLYAYHLGIPLVPVLLEPGFRADGWLGLLCATLIYTPFREDTPFEESLHKLDQQLAGLGKGEQEIVNRKGKMLELPSPKANGDLVDRQDSSKRVQFGGFIEHGLPYSPAESHAFPLSTNPSLNSSWASRVPSFCSQCSRSISVMSSTVAAADWSEVTFSGAAAYTQWTTEEVQAWLCRSGLGDYAAAFSAVDGSLLREMREMRRCAPEAFYKSVREDMKMGLVALQILTKALVHLETR